MTEHEKATIKPLTANDPEAQSADILVGNIEQLKTIFPEAFSEGKIDFEVLRQLLGDTVEEQEEKYGLNWHGKRKARQLALTPSTGTLRPCQKESVEWHTTQNLMIEGDNLEVLKLLQKSYSGKVKLIYIDPPYNTGKDFVYPDNFQDNIKNYLELTGQVEGGRKISSNTEASGRFHTDWLNMMYPRLKLARNLLSEDGVIFISCDDIEFANIRKICDNIFGEENFAGNVLWKKKTNGNNMGVIPPVHDYIVCYAKSLSDEVIYGFPLTEEQIKRDYSNPDNDPRGDWTTMDLSANHVGPHFGITNPATGEIYYPSDGRYWVFGEKEVLKRIAEGRIIFGKSGVARPIQKKFLAERNSHRIKAESWWDSHGFNADGTEEIGNLLTTKVFNHTKPSKLLQNIVNIASVEEELILDFFAGSGTTGHAVMAQNAIDDSNRHYILVQLPEPLDPENKDQKIAAEYCDLLGKQRTIAELTKERLRRAARKIKDENPLFPGDLGFRVFKLDSSNINTWEPDRDNLELALSNSIDHLKADRTEADILYELLLKLGLDLCVPIEKRSFAGKDVHSVGGGVLLVCLATHITRNEVELLAQGIVAWHKELAPAGETTCLFRDSAFDGDDVAKTNLAAILQQHGLEIIRSL